MVFKYLKHFLIYWFFLYNILFLLFYTLITLILVYLICLHRPRHFHIFLTRICVIFMNILRIINMTINLQIVKKIKLFNSA